jgi:predicted small lipoprotein YifL
MKRLTFLMTVISSLFLFSGCGQSGPLYVTGNPSQMAVPPSQESAQGTEQDDQESSDDSSGEG